MNILITSGGTSEAIDSVRRITNASTGRLGRIIAEEFAATGKAGKIWYVHGLKAVKPQSPVVENIPIESAGDLEKTVTDICGDNRVDAVIQAMAVGDYYVNAVTTVEAIADSISEELGLLYKEGLGVGGEKEIFGLSKRLAIAVMGARPVEYGSKISSDMEDLVLLLRKTPKVLARFRGMLPKAVIVGFKLLDRVAKEFLIDTAHEVLLKNSCDFVLANDLNDINDNGHIGYLVDKNKGYETFRTKEEIAKGIVAAVMAAR